MDYEIEDFELENELDIEDFDLYNEYNIEDFGVDVSFAGSKIQIYKGDDEPTDENILIWIDTSGVTPTGTQLITSDNLEFITANNEKFILKEV